MNDGRAFPDTDELIRRYLLGDLSDPERDELEDRYAADDAVFDRMQAVECDLIDDFARGLLSAEDHDRFEHRYLTSARRRRRVMFARALLSLVARRSTPSAVPPAGERATSRWAWAAALILVTAGGSWLAWQNRQLQGELSRFRLERAGVISEQDRRVSAVPDPSPSNLPPLTVAYVLSLETWRDASVAPRLVVPPDRGTVHLLVDLAEEDDYASYRAELQTASGEVVWEGSSLPPVTTDWGAACLLTLRASALAPGEYELAVSGVQTDGEPDELGYSHFSVVRRWQPVS